MLHDFTVALSTYLLLLSLLRLGRHKTVHRHGLHHPIARAKHVLCLQVEQHNSLQTIQICYFLFMNYKGLHDVIYKYICIIKKGTKGKNVLNKKDDVAAYSYRSIGNRRVNAKCPSPIGQ